MRFLHQTRAQFIRGASAACGLMAVPRVAFAGDAYAQALLARRPAGYWRLGERHGPSAVDASGNGHSGVYRGSPIFGVRGAIAGDSDGAVQLDGSHDYVEIPSSAAFSQPSSRRGLTVEVWMRPDVLTFAGQTSEHYVHWLGKGETGTFEWGFRFYSADSSSRPNRISAYIWNASGGEGAGAYFEDVLVPRRWMHIVASFDAGDASNPAAGVSIYRDGIVRGNPRATRGARYASYDIAATPGPAPVRLGTRDLGSFFTGALDDVAIYPRVLSAGEIAANYRAALS